MNAPAVEMEPRGDVRTVVICGSMSLQEAMQSAAVDESLAGKIVLLPHVNMKTSDPRWAEPADAEDIKKRLDELHLAKIDAADEVLVLVRAGHIGESTQAEIKYAKSLGRMIRYRGVPTGERFSDLFDNEPLPGQILGEDSCLS